MENLLILIIVGLAAAYIVRTFYTRSKKGAGCGCSACEIQTTCDQKPKEFKA